MYADIIVDISHENLDRSFQYHIPTELEEGIKIGSAVVIPFGKGKRELEGFVVDLSDKPKIDPSKIKDVLRLNEKALPVSSRMIALAAKMREMFGGTMNDALRTVLNVKKTVKPVEKKTVVLNKNEEETKILIETYEKKHALGKVRLLEELLTQQQMDKSIVTGKLNIAASTLEALVKDDVIRVDVEEVLRKANNKSYKKITGL
ncbi:MAG: primosomal protein N', partial [Lachnospiraceae bacterium]|nr:primosomal protein N' [Lachnospiraceae bacterium]